MRIFIPLTLLSVLALAELLVHIVYGWGCWGLQPGGKANMLIVMGFSVLLVATTFLALFSAGSRSRLLLRAGVAAAGLAISAAAYGTVGWRLFTSIHHQGPENLLLVGALSAATIAVSVATVTQPNPRVQEGAAIEEDGSE